MIQARFFQDATRITKATIQSRRCILGLTNEMVDLGQATRNDQVRARAELTQADLPTLRNSVRQSAVCVAVLLDQPVAHVLAQLDVSHHKLRPGVSFGAGIPTNLLRNRPDILVAKQHLAGAFVDLGVPKPISTPRWRWRGRRARPVKAALPWVRSCPFPC